VSRPGGAKLIAFEGVDGSGKSTQARLLAVALGAHLTFEPGDTDLGKVLREVLLHSGSPGARAETLLLAADRAQHVEAVVIPRLDAGQWVVTDRFTGSTLAYQGAGRGLDSPALRELLGWATGGLAADLSVLVDLDIESARRRVGATAPDRLERLGSAFFERVRRGYLAEAAADPGHWAVVDGDREIDEVAAVIEAEVRTRLGWPRAGS
jgi:dTMP kinase